MFIEKSATLLDINGINDALKLVTPKVITVFGYGTDKLKINLTEALTAQEDTDIDAAIAGFIDSDPELKVPYIYDLVNMGVTKHFHCINYKTELKKSLIPKRTSIKGEVIKVEWYNSLDSNNLPIEKVLCVDIVYTRDATGFAISRDTVRTWINRDGSDNMMKKITTKYYFINSVDQIKEGIKRRKLLVDEVQFPVLGMVVQALAPLGYTQSACLLKGRAFMDDYETEFNKFVENSSTITDAADPDFGMKTIIVKLRDEANTDHTEWLDKSPASLGGTTTIRQYLMNEFDI